MSEARPLTVDPKHDRPDYAPCPECGRLSGLSAVDGGKCLTCLMDETETAQLRAEVERLRKRELLLMLLLKVATHEPDSATREHSNAPR